MLSPAGTDQRETFEVHSTSELGKTQSNTVHPSAGLGLPALPAWPAPAGDTSYLIVARHLGRACVVSFTWEGRGREGGSGERVEQEQAPKGRDYEALPTSSTVGTLEAVDRCRAAAGR